jgi:hypothetical protein
VLFSFSKKKFDLKKRKWGTGRKGNRPGSGLSGIN